MRISELSAVVLFLVVSLMGPEAPVMKFGACAGEKQDTKEAPPLQGQAHDAEKLKALIKERRDFVKGQFDSCKKRTFELKDSADALAKKDESRSPAQKMMDARSGKASERRLWLLGACPRIR